jgi:hypothetical protein
MDTIQNLNSLLLPMIPVTNLTVVIDTVTDKEPIVKAPNSQGQKGSSRRKKTVQIYLGTVSFKVLHWYIVGCCLKSFAKS